VTRPDDTSAPGKPQDPTGREPRSGSGKKPWLKFWAKDWLEEPSLRLVSWAARGLWIDLLARMHALDDPGVLRVNGKALTDAQVARLVGGTPAEIGPLLRELEDAGVFDRAEDGAVVSRRMVRDVYLSQIRADAGSKGAQATWGSSLPRQSEWQTDGKRDGKSLARVRTRERAPAQASEAEVEVDNTLRGRQSPTASRKAGKKGKPRGHYRQTEYAPQTKDYVAAAKLLGLASESEIKDRAQNLLESDDKFYQRAADLSLLLSKWNLLATLPGKETA
jgi:hypothetical protein